MAIVIKTLLVVLIFGSVFCLGYYIGKKQKNLNNLNEDEARLLLENTPDNYLLEDINKKLKLIIK